MNKIVFYNGTIITPNRVIKNGSLLIENGIIKEIISKPITVDSALNVDVKGNYISPGFIDIHTHGAGGSDFMDATEEAFNNAAIAHSRHGTTSMVPTTLTSTMEELESTFKAYQIAKRNNKGAKFLGVHLEGPYFSMEQRGAQDPRYIKEPSQTEYTNIYNEFGEDIVRWTAAPELKGSMEFGLFLKNNNILASIGHSNAIYEEVIEAFEIGFTHITHLYSGMSGVRRINAYRYAGIIESAYLIDDMTVEIIADGKHLPASLLKLIYKIKGAENIALVTDSMRAAATEDKKSILGSKTDGQNVIVEDGVAKLKDRSAFAGSVATADRLVRTMIDLAEVPLSDAIKMMTLTPAKIIGVDKYKGSIVSGKDADITIFDKNINILLTMVEGNIIYNNLEI